MEQELLTRLEAQDAKLDAIYTSVEKTRRYFLWTLIISVAMIVLPLVGLVVAVPLMLQNVLGSVTQTALPAHIPTDSASVNTLIENISATAQMLQ